MTEFDCDLLVVGLGPTGDVLAGLSATSGLKVIAIDKAPTIHQLPRAAVFDHEVMRIFQMLGLADTIGLLCRVPDHYRFVNKNRDILLDFKLGGVETVSGWAESYALHQPTVESVLRARLIELGVDIRTETGFSGQQQDDNGVTVDVVGPAGRYQIRARYLVGCDGASSSVRDSIRAPQFNYDFDESWLVIDAIGTHMTDLPVDCMQICDPARPSTYLAMSPPRFRWEFMLKPGEDAERFSSDASIAALLAPWQVGEDVKFERRAVYRFHGLVAEQWRDRRVLLAGDAAHQMPPFAGQGMCSGIRDAGNLAWKLALVLKGEASDMLLDTYQEEREPHVRAIIEIAIAMGRVVCMLDPNAAAERDVGMLARKAAGAQDVSMAFPDLRGGCLTDTPQAGALFPQPVTADGHLDDLLPSSAWLVGHDLPNIMPASVHGVDLASSILPASHHAKLESWLTDHEAAAVLVRPDRHVFGIGSPQKLFADWQHSLVSPS